jgi:hypothetical protein
MNVSEAGYYRDAVKLAQKLYKPSPVQLSLSAVTATAPGLRLTDCWRPGSAEKVFSEAVPFTLCSAYQGKVA